MLYGLLAVVLMAMDQSGHYVPRLHSAAGHLAEPVYHAVEWPLRAGRDLLLQFQSRRSLQQENLELRGQLLGQKAELQRLDSLMQENRRLRSLFEGVQGQKFEYRIAELLRVDLDPFSHKVLIDRGSDDGVTEGQAVIDGMGVMGQVEDVHLHFSTVRLISDPNHALPVQINRTGLRTVAFGMGETGSLSLPTVPREADVREGDLLVTSGLGDRFPGGYPVALISRINREEGLSFAQLQARPLAALDRGREVLLISAVQNDETTNSPVADTAATQQETEGEKPE
ncbi:MAG: rod shape-determining protein MreC [Xanthomonadales bacterium]|nr:rod shape-determining protein MreC [Gammaproteobacteria bacterium]NND57606.1 rod shape-determining protein MreC [Xanthomonadales bacterium]NNK51330.1 rod shape-determining protein MreC [Xanthomonadales bacterium]